MKKLFTAALLAITVATSAFASDTKNVNAVVLSSFQHDFRNVSEVSWSATGDYAKATFVMNKQKMEAFYNESGDRIATSKSITLDELPVKAKRAFAKRLQSFTVKEALFMQFPDEEAYFISGETDKESVILKVTDGGVVSVYKRTNK
jgi:opacity protein-like surface antigen